jgi:hypothetical protein
MVIMALLGPHRGHTRPKWHGQHRVMPATEHRSSAALLTHHPGRPTPSGLSHGGSRPSWFRDSPYRDGRAGAPAVTNGYRRFGGAAGRRLSSSRSRHDMSGQLRLCPEGRGFQPMVESAHGPR